MEADSLIDPFIYGPAQLWFRNEDTILDNALGRTEHVWQHLGEADLTLARSTVPAMTDQCEKCGHSAACHESSAPQAPPVDRNVPRPHAVCIEEGCRCERFVPAGHLLEEA